jgi:hypothetical protein
MRKYGRWRMTSNERRLTCGALRLVKFRQQLDTSRLYTRGYPEIQATLAINPGRRAAWLSD